jgi:hypothetical protein
MPKPYRSDGKQTMSPIEVKRAELAKKKREIIKGQNTRISAPKGVYVNGKEIGL